MPGKLDIKIRGVQELSAALKDLDQKIKARLAGAATRAGARVIATEAKRRVHVVTGRLQRSIVVRSARRRRGSTEQRALVIARAPYAHIVELGSVRMAARPFLRPATDLKAQEAIDKMTQNLGDGITRELAKYGRSG